MFERKNIVVIFRVFELWLVMWIFKEFFIIGFFCKGFCYYCIISFNVGWFWIVIFCNIFSYNVFNGKGIIFLYG